VFQLQTDTWDVFPCGLHIFTVCKQLTITDTNILSRLQTALSPTSTRLTKSKGGGTASYVGVTAQHGLIKQTL